MKTYITVKGMKCPNCERHVKNALAKIDGVRETSADRTKDEAVVDSDVRIDDALLRKTIVDLGFEVAEIKAE